MLEEWFNKKIIGATTPFKGVIIVGYEFNRNLGPRSLYAKVVLSASSAEQFTFESAAKWPPAENYEEAVLKGILDTLFTISEPVLGVKFVLKEIGWHEINSCERAYYEAARLATIGILNQCGYKTL